MAHGVERIVHGAWGKEQKIEELTRPRRRPRTRPRDDVEQVIASFGFVIATTTIIRKNMSRRALRISNTCPPSRAAQARRAGRTRNFEFRNITTKVA
jgi:hypothetical protein